MQWRSTTCHPGAPIRKSPTKALTQVNALPYVPTPFALSLSECVAFRRGPSYRCGQRYARTQHQRMRCVNEATMSEKVWRPTRSTVPCVGECSRQGRGGGGRDGYALSHLLLCSLMADGAPQQPNYPTVMGGCPIVPLPPATPFVMHTTTSKSRAPGGIPLCVEKMLQDPPDLMATEGPHYPSSLVHAPDAHRRRDTLYKLLNILQCGPCLKPQVLSDTLMRGPPVLHKVLVDPWSATQCTHRMRGVYDHHKTANIHCETQRRRDHTQQMPNMTSMYSPVGPQTVGCFCP